jgi:hypothetical protein
VLLPVNKRVYVCVWVCMSQAHADEYLKFMAIKVRRGEEADDG